MSAPAAGARWRRAWEDRLNVAILLAMVALPTFAVLARLTLDVALPGANLWVQTLNLWIAFTGAALAAREGRHLALSTGDRWVPAALRPATRWLALAVPAAVCAMLAWASAELAWSERHTRQWLAGGVPVWVMQLVMPAGFAAMGVRFLARTGRWPARAAALLLVVAAAALALVPPPQRPPFVAAGIAIILAAVAFGAPIFTVLGGAAMLLFHGAEIPVPLSAVPAETYRLVASPSLPALPLFTLAGVVLAEGGSSRRLVRLFRALVGWMPGGIVTATVLVCAFFTTFTGASGVTILALGGLLLPVLTEAGYSRGFAVGLLAAAGSIGLLFPPSLPVILYGVVSHVPIDQLFLGGVLPGVLLVLALVALGVAAGLRQGVARDRFDPRETAAALLAARWELLLPVLVLGGLFGGLVTVFEAAALTAAWSLAIEVVIHRELSIREGMPRAVRETAVLMGGVLVILGVALGFTSWIVDARIPMALAEFASTHIHSQVVFILALNLALLVVGCLMDIYSAIVVVVPLIVPMAEGFGIHPVHLGILFLANLELGYLTPPVGLNLFLASFRFQEPLVRVYRLALPFLGVLAVSVVAIAFLPSLTTWGVPAPEPAAPAIEEPADAPPLPDLDMDAIMRELEGEPSGP